MFNDWTYQKSNLNTSKWFSIFKSEIIDVKKSALFLQSLLPKCPSEIVILNSLRSFVLWKRSEHFLSSNRQKMLMISSENHDLLTDLLAFRELCISYWFKSLSYIEENDPFFLLLLWILFLMIFILILKLVIMLIFF